MPALRRRWTEIAWSAHVHESRVDGRTLRWLDYGSGRPIVLVHGLGGSWTTWLENLPALGARHRVVAVDLPGFGGSQALPEPANLETHAAVLATLMEQLELRDTVLVGHSMGGLVVLPLARDRPDLVGRLVLVDAGGVPMTPLRLALVTRSFVLLHTAFGRPRVLRAVARRPRLRRLVLRGMVARPQSMTPELAAETIPLMGSAGFVGAVAAGARAVGAVDPADVRCPTLLIWGARDRVLPVAAAHDLLRRLPEARLEVFRDAAHCPMFEVPEAFDEALLAFADL